ncbi:hypothetical protein NSK_002506 [Nannochloropsis salina CCMP1776]|uniref:Uncharacterized protein n=1 Tax=Nannochloropsis salina CCMP1776 TaxID=1027361 RepID=A0A4D9DCE5_9STRA|nr:hypothetical protein NSK_002506 [Nannochloropsis salina CCMP1776]|eukprot:TFJ86298.1 hypothetical protein NSK_002506 [Nannochloropsis salina CCMP1776]
MTPPSSSTIDALKALNCSAQHFVAVVASWLVTASTPSTSQNPLQFPTYLSFNYTMHHSPPSLGEKAAAAEALAESQTQCGNVSRLACGALVEDEATIGAKRLGEYLVRLLRGESLAAPSTLLQETSAFGWLPAHAFVQRHLGEDNHVHSWPKMDKEQLKQRKAFRIEGGGGSGAGFQVYCGRSLLISAGGGGGGGVEGRLLLGKKGRSYSVGGGGGGGAQYRCLEGLSGEEDDAVGKGEKRGNVREAGEQQKQKKISLNRLGKWTSVGGGGGCGTERGGTERLHVAGLGREGSQQGQNPRRAYAPQPDGGSPPSNATGNVGILCGQALDAGTPGKKELDKGARALAATLQWCLGEGQALRMTGGGGGGGGTAECCEPMQLGYGFSFEVVLERGRGTRAEGRGANLGGEDGGWRVGEGRPLSADSLSRVSEAGRWQALRTGKQVQGLSSRARSETAPDAAPPSEGAFQTQDIARIKGETAAVDAQLRYDPLFRYLHEASQACPRGFQDWCCLCTKAKAALRKDEHRGERREFDERSTAWFTRVTCCRKEDTAASAGAASAGGSTVVPPLGRGSHPWSPQDDLPADGPPEASLGARGRSSEVRAGCALAVGRKGLVVVPAAVAHLDSSPPSASSTALGVVAAVASIGSLNRHEAEVQPSYHAQPVSWPLDFRSDSFSSPGRPFSASSSAPSSAHNALVPCSRTDVQACQWTFCFLVVGLLAAGLGLFLRRASSRRVEKTGCKVWTRRRRIERAKEEVVEEERRALLPLSSTGPRGRQEPRYGATDVSQ